MPSKITVTHSSILDVINRYQRKGINDPKAAALLKTHKRGMVTLDLKSVPHFIVRGLLFDKSLSEKQRDALTEASMKADPLRTPVTDPMQFHIAVTTALIEKALTADKKVLVSEEDEDYDDYDYEDDELDGRSAEGLGVCAEADLNGKTYPLALKSRYVQGFFFSGCILSALAQVWDIQYAFEWMIAGSDFVDSYGKQKAITPLDLMRLKGIRLLSLNLDEFKAEVDKADVIGRKPGTVLSVTGPALVNESFFFRSVQPTKFGSPEFPRKVVVEGEMECDDENEAYGVKLPFIRCFDLEQKRYVYVDARDVKDYHFDSRSAENIVLPEEVRGILHKVFKADVSQLFGDVVKGKHGGMVVLAHGKPGVGKTMTAETFAELARRPLYSMDIGELGIRLDTIEENLQKIFKRATRWNAVLLLDEADIFMAHRDNTSIERSAIVGIFLRLLDYFPGMLFLTTNRANQIDPAFLSRVTLKLNYPDLDEVARVRIWKMLLQAGELHVACETEQQFEKELGSIKVNGRQIKNIVRLLKVLYPQSVVSIEQIKEVATFSEDKGIESVGTVTK